MVLGALVGIAVQVGVESTGVLGPSVDALLTEQDENFAELRSQLDLLRNASSDPAVRKGLGELTDLLDRQSRLSERTQGELAYLAQRIAELEQQQLAETGFTGGADVWLKRGESISVSSGRVFSLLSARSNIADVNLDGERARMTVGDLLPVSSAPSACNIRYKQATPRADGRVGFDLDCD
ncbi:MAG: hypothetical protein R3176_07205 [Woeseiaceae bacterium]|nr:hypothetical protein [Woeseiaceae bacterium]